MSPLGVDGAGACPIRARPVYHRAMPYRITSAAGRLMAFALLAALFVGCGRDAAPIVESTPWGAVQTAFGDRFFDPEAREVLFSEQARKDLILVDALDAGRYAFLSVAELRRVDDRRRVGEVAFTVDGWPASIGVEMSRDDQGGWHIDKVAPPDEQQRLLDVLGPTGLPIAREVDPWLGGLAGRDAAGRPTAAVLLLVLGDSLFVDGGDAMPIEQASVVEALKAAIKVRRELADDATATYRPHVALALPRAAPSELHAQLAQWATDAGAEALQLIVRSREGSPAQVPLARRVVAPMGMATNTLRVRRVEGALEVSAGDDPIKVPDAGGQADIAGLGPALETMVERIGRPDGGIIEAHPDLDHGTFIKLRLAARMALPKVPFTSEVPGKEKGK